MNRSRVCIGFYRADVTLGGTDASGHRLGVTKINKNSTPELNYDMTRQEESLLLLFQIRFEMWRKLWS